MQNTLTVIVPIGDFTTTLARMVAEVLEDAAQRARTIVISLQWTARWSWDALCELEQTLRVRYRDVRVCFTAVSPAHRALMHEVGLGCEWIVDELPPGRARRVLLAA
jgi:anti-anti-sigma regulatory factor